MYHSRKGWLGWLMGACERWVGVVVSSRSCRWVVIVVGGGALLCDRHSNNCIPGRRFRAPGPLSFSQSVSPSLLLILIDMPLSVICIHFTSVCRETLVKDRQVSCKLSTVVRWHTFH